MPAAPRLILWKGLPLAAVAGLSVWAIFILLGLGMVYYFRHRRWL